MELKFKNEVGSKLKVIIEDILWNMLEGNDSEEQYEWVSDEEDGYNDLLRYLSSNGVLEIEDLELCWNYKFEIVDDKVRLEFEDVTYKYE
jgi:hypothetical protein